MRNQTYNVSTGRAWTALSPRGFRFTLGSPDHLLQDTFVVSNWSLRPAIFSAILATACLALIFLVPIESVVFPNDTTSEREMRLQNAREVHRTLYAGALFFGIVGLIRISCFSELSGENGSIIVRKKVLFVLSILCKKFCQPVPLVLVIAPGLISTSAPYAHLIFLGDPFTGMCIAGFKSRERALDWCRVLEPRYLRADTEVSRSFSLFDIP